MRQAKVFDGKNLENFLLLLDNYMEDNKVRGQRRVSVLVSYLGPALSTYRAWAMSNPDGQYHDLIRRSAEHNDDESQLPQHEASEGQPFEQFLMSIQEAATIAYQGADATTLANAVVEQFLLGLQHPQVQEVLLLEDFSNPLVMLQRAQKVRDCLKVTGQTMPATSRTNMVARECPSPVLLLMSNTVMRQPGQHLFTGICWNCDRTGHIAGDCKQPKRQLLPNQITCSKCKVVGHRWRKCPTVVRETRSWVCPAAQHTQPTRKGVSRSTSTCI